MFGVGISPVTYDKACDAIFAAAAAGQPAVVSAFAVHALVTAAGDPALRAKVNRFAIITPDGSVAIHQRTGFRPHLQPVVTQAHPGRVVGWQRSGGGRRTGDRGGGLRRRG